MRRPMPPSTPRTSPTRSAVSFTAPWRTSRCCSTCSRPLLASPPGQQRCIVSWRRDVDRSPRGHGRPGAAAGAGRLYAFAVDYRLVDMRRAARVAGAARRRPARRALGARQRRPVRGRPGARRRLRHQRAAEWRCWDARYSRRSPRHSRPLPAAWRASSTWPATWTGRVRQVRRPPGRVVALLGGTPARRCPSTLSR